MPCLIFKVSRLDDVNDSQANRTTQQSRAYKKTLYGTEKLNVSENNKENNRLSLYSLPARPPKVIQKAIFNNIQSESCDEVEIAA